MEKNIISNVTEQGLLIPKELLIGIDKVEIFKSNNIIKIIPIGKDNSILKLGKNPVSCGVTDASEKHDKYISG